MGKLKNKSNKSYQLLDDEIETTTVGSSKGPDTKSQNGIQQVFIQQSVTILAFKDKSFNNGTSAPDVLHPKLFLGLVSEDLSLFIGAVIGASLIIALCLMIITFWKCCCRMTIFNKKKEYWLEPKNSNNKNKRNIPTVVQSNSVVFLGLKSTQMYNNHQKQSTRTNSNTFSSTKLQELNKRPQSEPHHIIMAEKCPDIMFSDSTNIVMQEPKGLPDCAYPENSVTQSCSLISKPSILNNSSAQIPKSNVLIPNNINIPNVIIHHDSPALLHQSFYSDTFDQHSLYSCQSHLGSELDLKTCSLTWSNYSLRPSSTSDCYYDLFQKASFCKKRKNRMRSDIAAAIAMNRSQSSQLNKDTDSLVENEVEVILDERTTL